MRLARLELIAYGPFRGKDIDLSQPGLQILFGRNEAGKSTTLRAITGLFYGIDPRTRDAHTHKREDLRIGGVVVGSSGERVHLVRRKGNANTLLDAATGQTVDEAVLKRLLAGVSEETFRHAFGLDHDTLARGAEALLEGKGDLGESLFDASVGGGGEVQRLLGELTLLADKIYKPRATSLPLNDALRAFADAQKLVKERQSLPEAYVTQERARDDAKATKKQLVEQRAALATRRAGLERDRRRGPLERRRRAAEAIVAEFGPLARHAMRLAALRERSSAYERARREAREIEPTLARLSERVDEAALQIGGEVDARSIRVDPRREAKIQHLLVERSKVVERIDAASTEIARAARELERLRATAAREPVDVTRLSAALERSRALGDAETRLQAERTRAVRRRTELEARAKSIGHFTGSLRELVALGLPSREALDPLVARVADLERAVAKHEERAADVATELRSVERQIAEHSGDFAPPTADELIAARAARDALLAARDFGAFEKAMRGADELADRMIREAERVTLLARLRASRDALARDHAAIGALLAERRAALASALAEHERLFVTAGLTAVGSPASMRGWLERHAQIVEAYERVEEAVALADEGERDVQSRAAELALAMGVSTPGGLAELVVRAAREVEREVQVGRETLEAKRAVEILEREIEGRRLALAKDEETRAAVRHKLVEATLGLGIDDDASADEVARALELRRNLFALVDKKADVEARVQTIAREVAEFENEVRVVVSELAPDLTGLSPEDATATLAARSQKGEAAEAELADLRAQLAEFGQPGEELAALADDPEAARRALDELDAEIAELDRDLSRIDQNIGGLERGLESMRGDSHAADAAADVQAALSAVRTHAERYARAKLAQLVMSREIEKYREENQGPLLAAASTLFERLTLGAFVRVRAGFDDKDKPALRCVRSSGEEVDVTGLSEGTRDQLYLSLRLASLGRYAEIAEPMPLVLDDIFVHFDDERARAGLAVLAEMATRTQVLFFTHHARLVELARAAVGKDLRVHELGGGPSLAPNEASV